jgi:hypothetical protein
LLDQARSLERIRQSQRQMDMIHHTPSQQLQRNEEMMMLEAELRRRERMRNQIQMSRTQDQPDVSAKHDDKQQSQISSHPIPNRQLQKRNTPFNPAA